MIPDLSILPQPQRLLFPELRDTPDHFVLCGGTAIALRLGHRVSVDFDFFSQRLFDADELYLEIPYLFKAEILDKGKDTLNCLVDRQGFIKLSFFGGLPFDYIEAPERIDGIGIKIASLIDLSGMKAAVLQKRAASRDYIDIDALMTKANLSLESILAAGQVLYGYAFNPTITLKALTYYADGDLLNVPIDMRLRLIHAVKNLNVEKISEQVDVLNKKRRCKDD